MSSLWDQLLKDIEHELKICKNDFLSASTIAKTLCPKDTRAVDQIVNSLYNKEIPEHLKDPRWGKAHLDQKHGVSLSTAQTVRYVALMQQYFSSSIIQDVDHIVDIGGGFGNMYRIFNLMGYRGKYQIIDFPLIHSLQRRYLERAVDDFSNLEQIELNMEKAWPVGKSMLIATHSVNEMPLEVRAKIESYYKNYNYIFINHNKIFNGVDNMKYFNNIVNLLKETHNSYQFNCPIHKSHWFKLFAMKEM